MSYSCSYSIWLHYVVCCCTSYSSICGSYQQPGTCKHTKFDFQLEIRTDAYRCLQDFNRPHYRGAQDIGTWLYILEVLGVIAVITNCLLIGFSYGAIHNLVNDNFYVLIIIVVLEVQITSIWFLC